jgi:hypothetical protein
MKEDYESSGALEENNDGNLPRSRDAFDKNYAEWENRKWLKWLKENLSFPFTVQSNGKETNGKGDGSI